MLTLFHQYKDNRKLSEALLVGHNLFNRNPSDKAIFASYYDFLCSFAEAPLDLSDRTRFAGQAQIALEFFKENAELDEDTVTEIISYQERLTKIETEIQQTELAHERETLDKLAHQNNDYLQKLFSLKDQLRNSTSQKDFDEALTEIKSIDNQIDKNHLTDEQNQVYESLTKMFTDLISEKMREFEYQKNVDYNRMAASSFKKAFESFQKDPDRYKTDTNLRWLISTYLGAYDASRLFNETLIYYNHVYSFIFNNLNDDEKFLLTKYSIECERKLR